MRCSFWILLLVGLALSGCAAPGPQLDRDLFRAEIATAAILDAPRETPSVPRTAGHPPQEEPATDPDRPEDHDDASWRRRSESDEIAIIRDHLKRDPKWKEQFIARRTAVTLFGQLSFAHDTSAIDSDSPTDPDWNELMDPGYGVGLELSYDVLPILQPLIGAKVNLFQDDSHEFVANSAWIERDTSELRTVPIYAGVRLNFPLDLSVDEWFDPDAAGCVTGAIPFLRAAGGAAWICGQELTLHDKTSNITSRTDFVRRGWTGYFELAAGIEYRVKKGFAFELTVGFERYLDMKLDREFRNLFPAADSEPLTVFFLPRLGASYYF